MPQSSSEWFRFWYGAFTLGVQQYQPYARPVCMMILPSCDPRWREWYLQKGHNDNERQDRLS